ncbi:MAG: hypothetical protein WD468_10650 [Pirellulales bacterium]
MFIEPEAFYWKKDKRRSLAIYSSWADEAWSQQSQGCPELAGRTEYAVGFRDGFVDYVYGGGTGEPPLIPPRHLWNVDFRSEEGHQRADDWFAGYRHGAQVARDEGYRSLATVRSSLFGMDPRDIHNRKNDIWMGNGLEAPGVWSTTEPLPTPAEEPVLPPDTIEAEGEIDQPAETTPASKPIVPPPPRNLPSPIRVRPPADSNDGEDQPVDAPATEWDPINEIEPAPLSIPQVKSNEEQPAGAGTMTELTALEPNTSSVRIIGAPIVAGRPPRDLPAVSPPPSRMPAKSIDDRRPKHSQLVQPAIRLTAATSTAGPAAITPQASTIRMCPSISDPRSPASPNSASLDLPITR